MRKFIFVTLLVLASGTANAQFGSNTGNTSNTGNSSNTGSATGNASTGLTNTQFGQAFNFSNNGMSATGITSPFGNTTTTGRTGMMGMGGMGMMGMGGMGMGMGMGGMGMGGMGMGGMGGRGQQQNGRGGMGGMGGTGQQQYTLRPTVKLGFDVPMPNSQARGQQIQITMAKLPQPSRFAGANIAIDGRKAIVTGDVDRNQRELLKRLLLLEPGIYEVDMSRLDGATSGDSSSSRANRQDAESVTPADTVPSPKQ